MIRHRFEHTGERAQAGRFATSLTIRSDPEMNRDAVPTGKRGRRQTYDDAAILTCPSMKALFGMVDIGSAIGPSVMTL
ncbi:transposase [Roseisalinus antarcticus]|uniref:transposase n=1 Tax=Roseisalinus antarcticus TaxID=254357 RepID=UPI000A272792